jgi:hypothetical protein
VTRAAISERWEDVDAGGPLRWPGSAEPRTLWVRVVGEGGRWTALVEEERNHRWSRDRGWVNLRIDPSLSGRRMEATVGTVETAEAVAAHFVAAVLGETTDGTVHDVRRTG